MNITLFVATDLAGAIGREGTIPWHLHNDMRHFRVHTTGTVVLMGRRTAESLRRALPNRTNLVLSCSDRPIPEKTRRVRTVAEAIRVSADLKRPLSIIGGAEVYAAAMPWVTRAWVTTVFTRVEGADAHFHFPDDYRGWNLDWSAGYPANSMNDHAHTIQRWSKNT